MVIGAGHHICICDWTKTLNLIPGASKYEGVALLRVGQIDKALDLASCYKDMRYSADYCYVMELIFVNNGMIDNAVTMFTKQRKGLL